MDCLQKFKSITARGSKASRNFRWFCQKQRQNMFVEELQYHKRNVDNLFLLENTEASTEPGVNSPHHPVTLQHERASEHLKCFFPSWLSQLFYKSLGWSREKQWSLSLSSTSYLLCTISLWNRSTDMEQVFSWAFLCPSWSLWTKPKQLTPVT